MRYNLDAVKCTHLKLYCLMNLYMCKIAISIKRVKISITTRKLTSTPFSQYPPSSVAQSCMTLCNPMNCSMQGLPVHHQCPEFTQTSCPLSWWCHPTISSSDIPFYSHLQSFPASGSFLISQLFTLDGQSNGVSASASVFPMIQLFTWVGQSIGVSASASVLPMKPRTDLL